MNQVLAVALGAMAVVAASPAHGQERSAPTPDKGYVLGVGSSADGSARDHPRSSPPLFTFGGLDVRVWAPVKPHYNAAANPNPAGQALWGAG
jgi:hypothetical protein